MLGGEPGCTGGGGEGGGVESMSTQARFGMNNTKNMKDDDRNYCRSILVNSKTFFLKVNGRERPARGGTFQKEICKSPYSCIFLRAVKNNSALSKHRNHLLQPFNCLLS